MQANGQCQQAGQLQLTHPHFSYNANGSHRGYENNTSYNGVGALVGHHTMHNVGVKLQSTQKQNNFLALNNGLPTSSHLDYYPNSTQNASNQNTATVNLNHQLMLAQKTSVSGNSQSAVLNNNLPSYHSHFKLQATLKKRNQRVNSRTDNVSVPMTDPTTSSTMQRMCYTQQPAVQSHMNNQTFQQASCGLQSSPYTPNVNVAFLNVPNVQDAQNYTVTPVTLTPITLSTSCVNRVVANNQTVQNNYFVSQTNDIRSVHSVNGCTPLSNQMVTSNANSQGNSMTAVPVQTQKTSARGYIHMQTQQPILLAANDNNTPSALLPSPTYSQKNVSAAPLQTTMPTNNQSFNPSGNGLFYHKMNNVSNNPSLCIPLNQASEISRCEAPAKIDTVSSAQAKDCALQISPGRGTRAVAVVLPLSQESSPTQHPSPSSQSCSNPASGSCFFSSNQLDKAPVQTQNTSSLKQILEQKLHQSTNSSNIFTEKTNTQALSPSQRIGLQDAGTKLSTLPLTFAQLVEGNCSAKVSGRRKSKSGNKKTPKEQKTCEEKLSSVPTTEWTLTMLYAKIVEMENKENEQKSDNNECKYDGIRQIICTFWNGDCKELLNAVRNRSLSKEVSDIRDFCRKIDIDTVILSQNQSNHPSRYHALLHDEVYEEKNTCTSSWLNINQLDDIDKEFGLPYFLKYGKNCSKSVDAEPKSNPGDSCQPEIKFAIPKPEEHKNEDYPSNTLSNPICSIPFVTSTSTNSEEEKHNTFAHSDPEKEKEAQSNDSSYSFKIEVLPPEEAKVIFKQIEINSLQVEDTAVSDEILPSDRDDAENKTCHVTSLENICCIEKWKEKVYGLSTESKCKCEEQNQNEDKLEQSKNKNSWLLGTVDLTEDDDICIFTQESENIQEDKSPNKSRITISSEDESLVSDKDHATQAGQHGEHDQDLVISTESQKDIGKEKNILDNSSVNKSEMTMSDKSLEQVQDCRKASSAEMTQTANPASSQPVCASDVKDNKKRLASENLDPLHQFKKPKLSSHLKSQTILESFSKCRNGKPSQTVELALFGSNTKKGASGSSQQTQIQSSLKHTRLLFEKTEEAPRRLYVKFSPFPNSDKQEDEPSGNISIKERIHEKWRKSLPLSTIRLKRKNKKFTIVSASHGATIHLSPAKHKDKHVASKRKSRDSDDGQRHKKMFLRNRKALNTLKKPVDDEVMPLPENVLKFDVLPNTFNLQGSNDTDSTTDAKADEKTVPVPAEGNLPVLITKGAWRDKSTSKSPPESPSSVPESTGLFQEFQRRYKMRQASTDE